MVNRFVIQPRLSSRAKFVLKEVLSTYAFSKVGRARRVDTKLFRAAR